MISAADIDRICQEDVGGGDLTTDALGIGDLAGDMVFRARGEMIVAGIDVASRMMAGLSVEISARDGDRLATGNPILSACGSAGELHRAWKSAQTLIEILSGIATATRAIVDAAAKINPDVRIATTRKTVPGARKLSQLAVRAGGGILHRQGLGETILVFSEHRAFLPGKSFADLATHLRRAQPEKALGIEVATIDEAREAIDAGFHVIQLEKFSAADVAAARAYRGQGVGFPLIAAAGGISPETVADYVAAGAGLIVTSWPYTARPRDVAVTITPRDY